jgi:hypothetical protein
MGYNNANEMCDKNKNASARSWRCGRVSPQKRADEKRFTYQKTALNVAVLLRAFILIQILIYRDVRTDFARLFCVAFSKATARAALAQKTAFSFCKAFSFGPLASKEKASLDF